MATLDYTPDVKEKESTPSAKDVESHRSSDDSESAEFLKRTLYVVII
jgi:hypothetical protein